MCEEQELRKGIRGEDRAAAERSGLCEEVLSSGSEAPETTAERDVVCLGTDPAMNRDTRVRTSTDCVTRLSL